MKKLSKLVLRGKADLLNDQEMRRIKGQTNNCPSSCSGSCTVGSYTGRCGWTNWPNGTTSCTCAYGYGG
jgi:natural product precursor